MENWEIPQEVEMVITCLQENGAEAFLVGGAIRDLLLKVTPHDWDLVTSASLETIKELFPQSFLLGKKEKTLTVVFTGFSLEISSYRDGSKSLKEDLSKRDFTLNSLAYDLKTKKIIDPFHGEKDLQEKCLRTIEPQKAFHDDPLRMLRAIRFFAQYGFRIEKNTEQAIFNNAFLLNSVAMERIRDELASILLTPRVACALNLAEKLNLLSVFLPELAQCFAVEQNAYHNLDVAGHILKVVELLPANNLELRIIGLLHDLGKPKSKSVGIDGRIHFYGHENFSAQIASKVLARLKIGSTLLGHNIDQKKILVLVKNHMFFYQPETSLKAVRKLLAKIGPQNAADFLALHRADILAGSPAKQKRLFDVDRLTKDVEKIITDNTPLTEKDLALSGQEIMDYLNLPTGKKIGKLKIKLLQAVLDNPQLNTKETLKNLLKNY